MSLKEYLIILVMVLLFAMAPLIILQEKKNNLSEMEELEKYGVYEVKKISSEEGDTLRLFQVRNTMGQRLRNELDKPAKVDLCYILGYSYNNFEDIKTVEVISYYNNSGNLVIYYVYEIETREIEISELSNVSEAGIMADMEYYYRKIIKLGDLKVMDDNIPYWKEADNGYNSSDK
ncbi:conserved hypothetical protein [Methanococcus maripaludis C5]|uniref:Uncharacterized protein n=1 Tax=Methanococcus maripaludis (strain C5 / ATCC BAA-1333) TaxID=402880 RepID=A4FVU6_METM5|nr:hypothetical protein [Methanococcus maripaludis]ABO34644.1 conserved hypothetical protein [Methanococcus maripaludis C5]